MLLTPTETIISSHLWTLIPERLLHFARQGTALLSSHSAARSSFPFPSHSGYQTEAEAWKVEDLK